MTMPLCAFFIALLATQQTPYSLPQSITQPTRLARTPIIDGAFAAGEWDALWSNQQSASFLQWEPGKLYVAAKTQPGQDLVISIDAKMNGWLVGKDNYEFRFKQVGADVRVEARQLDATNLAGPVWVPLPGFDLSCFGKTRTENGEVTLEGCIIDPGLGLLNFGEDTRFLVRTDLVPSEDVSAPATTPRVGSEVRLGFERASALPIGLNWKVEHTGREVVPGNSTKMRFSFSTKETMAIKTLDVKPEGPMTGHAATLGVPFPRFDNKGRAFVDYDTKTSLNAPTGYQVVTATLTTADGAPAVIEASLRVAPLIDFQLANSKFELNKKSPDNRIVFFIQSNSVNRVDGKCDVTTPNGWEILKGDQKSFIIYNSRSAVRRVLMVSIPPGTKGTFPIRFKGQIGKREFEEVRWLTIQ